MRRFVSLVVLLLFTIPFGISISGCAKKNTVTFCSGNSGPVVGQAVNITLSPRVYGVSLNFGQIGATPAPAATDCKGGPVTISAYNYGSSDNTRTIVDVNPANGALCAGTWNRQTGGGIADYTFCNSNGKSGTALIVASANGANSNPLPVYVHPTVSNVVLSAPSTDCSGDDPATNCSPAAFSTSPTSCTVNPTNGCCTTPLPTSTAYVSTACISQGTTGQLAAKVYSGTGSSQTNISCRIGHLTYNPQTSGIVTIDQNGVATAQAPGSTIITASVANAGSSAGLFATCPPINIALSVPIVGGNSVSVNPNNPQPLNAIATDINNTVLTGLTLEYVSTTPTTIPGGSTITPLFPGTAGITAICQPPTCNSSPFNQIGLFGTGTPVLSNELTVTAPGKNSTVLYIASTQSQYIVPVDFTQPTIGAPVRLPYVPTSMVINNGGTSIYMGTANGNGLMTFNALTNGLTSVDPTVTGNVLAVSPDDSTVVITDPTRQLVYLYTTTAATTGGTTPTGTTTQYGGVGTRAAFTPDSQTVYITTTDGRLLVYSKLTGWSSITLPVLSTDVAVTVPSAGAFLAGATTTARGQCPITVTTTLNGVPSTSNTFFPDAGVTGLPATDRLTATNDGMHILGATASPAALSDILIPKGGIPIGACPMTGAPLQFTATPGPTSTLPGVTAQSITGVDPTSDSKIAFVTYTGSGSVLPSYTPLSGSLTNIPLTGTATAPVAGVLSSDDSTFYVGTSGDNDVHIITSNGSGTWTDDPTKTIVPQLPGINGGTVTPNLLVQRPRKSTS